ncbi:MAG: hypothetical protein COV10_01480 [Candidatus Vogelbacteria bacterium CG10_big_fil_rev_8_21_14_0_10_51_16]|uniref:Septum formation initiator n=1 Tax=Candidatus Vogelbacteria bacterium CG10_big_fil_rev_8_21_14_0_10_51_16 TaxID=1975045 RepID=A0A2H0RF29_9BACT|nr:MAG: hypothetical protein COV10_01480 [Candidatus Vogelbacteria bacterium CG10_big_fil_rev_8_21_14_0_10_51_16]
MHHKVVFAIWTGALILLVVLLSKAVWGISRKERATAATRASADSELEYLQARKKEVEAEVVRLSSSSGQEAELRTKYQVAAPGEQVIILVEERATTTADKQIMDADSRWQRFLKMLKKS